MVDPATLGATLDAWNLTPQIVTGIPGLPASENYCQNLYETLIRNYSCMREGMCAPFGMNQWAFIIGLCFLLLLTYFLGQYVKEKELEKKK